MLHNYECEVVEHPTGWLNDFAVSAFIKKCDTAWVAQFFHDFHFCLDVFSTIAGIFEVSASDKFDCYLFLFSEIIGKVDD